MQQSRFSRFISAHLPSRLTISSSHIVLHSFVQFSVTSRSSILLPLLSNLPTLFFTTSLRADLDTLASLREKLSILWGDLEERKSESSRLKSPFKQPEDTNSPPFECCLKEYGIRSRKRRKSLKEDDDRESDEDDDDDNGDDDERAEGGAGELGHKMRLWERRWRMWGTTIS